LITAFACAKITDMERARRKALKLSLERLPLVDKATFSFGVFGKDAGNTFVGIYYMFFLTQVISLNAAAVGAVFAVSRLFFAFTSPLVGTFIDNTRTRIGKYRPWVLMTVIIAGVTLFAMFMNIPVNIAAKYVFYLSFYVIWEISTLALDIAVWAFLPALTHNVSERNQMTSFAKIFSGMGSGLIAAGVPFLLTFFFGSEYEPKGYFFLAVIVTVIMFTGGFLVYLLNKERVIIDSDFIKLKDLFRSIFQNDQLIAYFVSFLLINMAAALTNNFAIYFFAFDFGDMRYFGLFTLIAGLGQGIAVFTYPALAKRAPIRTILIIATLLSTVGYLLMLAIVIIFGVKSIILLCSVSALMLFSGGWLATASQAMLLDITDYGEYKLGNRTASVVFSANTMMWRIINSLIILSLGICLTAAGINGVNLESGIIPQVSLKGLWLIRSMMFGLPVLCLIGGLMVFLKKYILNAREMAYIQESLQERRILAEEKKRAKEEMKRLSLKLKEEKKISRREYWRKKFKSDHTSFRRSKKLSIDRAKKRMSLFSKDDDDDEFDIKN